MYEPQEPRDPGLYVNATELKEKVDRAYREAIEALDRFGRRPQPGAAAPGPGSISTSPAWHQRPSLPDIAAYCTHSAARFAATISARIPPVHGPIPHDAGWSSLVAPRAHNPKVTGSISARATNLRVAGPGLK